ATGNLATGDTALHAIDCMLDAGASGCFVQQPLRAIETLVARSRGKQDGFLRDGALLAIVILTDGDDCSLDDASDLFDPAGASDGPAIKRACAATADPALSGDPAVRLRAVASAAGKWHDGSICATEHGSALSGFALLVADQLRGSGCLAQRVADPDHPRCRV